MLIAFPVYERIGGPISIEALPWVVTVLGVGLISIELRTGYSVSRFGSPISRKESPVLFWISVVCSGGVLTALGLWMIVA